MDGPPEQKKVTKHMWLLMVPVCPEEVGQQRVSGV